MEETQQEQTKPEVPIQPNAAENSIANVSQEPEHIQDEPLSDNSQKSEPSLTGMEPISASESTPAAELTQEPEPSSVSNPLPENSAGTAESAPPKPAFVPPSEQTPAPKEAGHQVDFRTKVREGMRKKRERRIDKLLVFIREKQKVTNSDIRKRLGVSDATATRYAEELIRRGLLKKSGRTKSARYETM